MSSHHRRPKGLRATLQRWKMRLFLVALLTAIVSYPFLENDTTGYLLLAIGFSVVLLAAVYAVSHRKKDLMVGLALGIPALAANWLRFVYPEPTFILANHVLAIVFYVFIIYSLLKGVLTSKRVTSDVLYGAVAVYFLIAIAWAWVFSLIEFLAPGSFLLTIGPRMHQPATWSDLAYFSFTTFTSLGFGDVLPITSQSRAFAVLETIGGVLYITVLIGRLVGLYSGEVAEATAEKVEEYEEKRGR